MMEENRENLRRAIDGMKVKQEQAPDVWSGIEQALSEPAEIGKENLENAVSSLQEMKAPDVWDGIAGTLVEESANSLGQRVTYIWVAAASVAILIVAFVALIVTTPSESNLVTSTTYSSEEVILFDSEELSDEFESREDGVLTYVEKNCKNLISKCKDPEFKGLFDAYLEMGKAQEELKGQLAKTDNKQQIFKYLIRLEKERAEVGKDLLKMLRYS